MGNYIQRVRIQAFSCWKTYLALFQEGKKKKTTAKRKRFKKHYLPIQYPSQDMNFMNSSDSSKSFNLKRSVQRNYSHPGTSNQISPKFFISWESNRETQKNTILSQKLGKNILKQTTKYQTRNHLENSLSSTLKMDPFSCQHYIIKLQDHIQVNNTPPLIMYASRLSQKEAFDDSNQVIHQNKARHLNNAK